MAPTGKDILLDQLSACQDDESWYVPLSIALNGLTAGEAAWHEPGSTNSVWHIVNHLAFWNENWLQRFQGMPITTSHIDNDATFGDVDHQGDEVDWKASVARLNAVLSQWRNAIAACSEAQLDGAVPDFPVAAPWWGVISNLVTHNVYHIGQIVSIRKAQGSWKEHQQ